MKTIIVLSEASEVDTPLLEQARIQAIAFNSMVYLIHVAAPDPDFIGYDDVGPQHERDWRAGTLRHEHRQLQQQANDLRGQGVDAEALLVQGPTVVTVLAEVKRLHADFLILGNHHKGLFQRLVSCSIREDILHQVQCPILFVPVNP